MLNKDRLILLIFLSAIVLASVSCLKIPNFGLCQNTNEKELSSPDGKFKAAIFDRGCGATVGFITGISIISSDETISNEDAGNALFAENVYREFFIRMDKLNTGKRILMLNG